MSLATMTSKGQVTIPKTVRDSLRLNSGDRIDFVLTGQGEVVLRPVTKRVDDVYGRLHRPGRKPLSVREMDALVKAKIGEMAG